MHKIPHLIFLLFLALTSCYNGEPSEPNRTPVGLRPIYANKDSVNTISSSGPILTTKAGKIYVYGNYLFQNEVGQGIHVIDNTNPEIPFKIAFYRIPLCTEISIKNGHLYTNNGSDLAVLDISKIKAPELVKRLPDEFPSTGQTHPENVTSGTYFECPNPSKGIVVGWESAVLSDPKCQTL